MHELKLVAVAVVAQAVVGMARRLARTGPDERSRPPAPALRERRGPGWVSDGTFLTGYGAAQALPGPLFAFAAYLGAVAGPRPNGVLGGAIALSAIFAGPLLLLVGALPFWERLRAAGGFRRALLGTNAAVVGILAAALYAPIWTSAVAGPADVAIIAGALALLATGRTPPIVVVALCAAAGQALAAL